MTTAAADFMTRFGQVWVTGKTDEVDELMPADVVYHLPPFPDMDREALKGFITGFHQAFPDFTLTIDENISDNDVSAHRWTCQATYAGESPLLRHHQPESRRRPRARISCTGTTDGRPRSGTTATGSDGCKAAASSPPSAERGDFAGLDRPRPTATPAPPASATAWRGGSGC